MIPIDYTLTGAKSRELGVDGMTHVLNTIGYEHHEIHEGNHFFVAGYGTFAADEDIDFQITTPLSQKLAHMTFSFQSTGAVVFSIYEGAVVQAGTSVTPINSDRNSANTSSLTVQYDGVVDTAGSLIYQQAWGYTNTPSKSEGGVSGRDNEIILRAGTTYRFLIERDSARNIISYNGECYEHTNKE